MRKDGLINMAHIQDVVRIQLLFFHDKWLK